MLWWWWWWWWWRRGGGGGGGGICSLGELLLLLLLLLDSPPTLEEGWARWALELEREVACVRVAGGGAGVGVRARHTSPSHSCRQGRPYSWAVRGGQQDDQPRSRTKKGYSSKTFSNS